jgi:hypothetical protein
MLSSKWCFFDSIKNGSVSANIIPMEGDATRSSGPSREAALIFGMAAPRDTTAVSRPVMDDVKTKLTS